MLWWTCVLNLKTSAVLSTCDLRVDSLLPGTPHKIWMSSSGYVWSMPVVLATLQTSSHLILCCGHKLHLYIFYFTVQYLLSFCCTASTVLLVFWSVFHSTFSFVNCWFFVQSVHLQRSWTLLLKPLLLQLCPSSTCVCHIYIVSSLLLSFCLFR